MNFSVTTTPTSLTIKHAGSKAKLSITLDGKTFTASKDKGDLPLKEQNCLTYLSKFSLDMLNKRSNKPASSKLDMLHDKLMEFRHVPSFRTLNNSMRRAFDDGSQDYISAHFYEGAKARTTGDAAPVKKATATPAKKAPKAAIPAVKAVAAKKPTPRKAAPVQKQAAPVADLTPVGADDSVTA